MSVVLFASFSSIVVASDILLSPCKAEETKGASIAPTRENRTVRNEYEPSLESSVKKSDRWPPVFPAALDPEVTQAHQYSPWLQQSALIPNYYAAAGSSVSAPIGQVRSEHYAYPSEYGEYGNPSPMVSQGSANALGVGSKHLAIVSFIGLLLLFAIIQNSLMAAKRKDALVDVLTGRKKRDLLVAHGLGPITPEQEDILNDDAKLRCIQRTVCLENRKIIENLGAAGKALAKYLTNDVKKSVKSSFGWDRLIEDAGEAGLRGENCDVLYRDCAK